MKKHLCIGALIVASACCTATAEGTGQYMPEIHGTIRAKYEYEPQIGSGRFEIRNARMSVEGRVIPVVRCKAEIDLSDEGAIKMLDAYIRFQPKDPCEIAESRDEKNVRVGC